MLWFNDSLVLRLVNMVISRSEKFIISLILLDMYVVSIVL